MDVELVALGILDGDCAVVESLFAEPANVWRQILPRGAAGALTVPREAWET